VVRFEAKHQPKRAEIKRGKRAPALDAEQLERIKEAEFPLGFRRRILKTRQIEQLAEDAEMTVTAEEVEALWSQELLDLIQYTAIAFAEAATQPTADNNLLSSIAAPDRQDRGAKRDTGRATSTKAPKSPEPDDTRTGSGSGAGGVGPGETGPGETGPGETGPGETGPGETDPDQTGTSGDAEASLVADRGNPAIDRAIETEPTQPGDPTMSADATSVEDTSPPQLDQDPPAPAAALAAEESAGGDSAVAAPAAEPEAEPVLDSEQIDSEQIDFDSLVDASSETAAEVVEPTTGPSAPPSPDAELPAEPAASSDEPEPSAPVDEGAGADMAESMLFAENESPAVDGPDDATEAVVDAAQPAGRDPSLREIHSEVQQVGIKQDRLAASMETVREDVRETRIDTSANTRATVEAIAALRVLQGRMLAAGSGRRAQPVPAQGQTYVVLCVALLAITWGIAFYLKTGDLTLALAGVLVANFLGCVAIYARDR